MINLFTVPPQSASSPDGSSAVVSAIREGSGASGADFDYLLRTAGRESAFDPQAKAQTSSASGLFQFIDQTWLRMVKRHGASVGLDQEARAIAADGSGRLTVSDPARRVAILNLRHDPKLASTLAGFLTRENAADLATSLGRKVSVEELYLAHVLGSSGAADLIKLSMSDPDRPAAPLFSDAARANPALFYDRSRTQAKTLAEVRNGLAESYRNASLDFAALVDVDQEILDIPVAIKTDQTKSLHTLFQNRSDVVPLNSYVSALWSSPQDGGSESPPSYFPAAARGAYGSASLPPLPDARADVPLPPRRSASSSSP